MRVIISAGGTGGHIYPAISIINKIKEMNKSSEILYIGTTDRMERDIIPNLGIKYIGIKTNGVSKNIIKLTKFVTNTYLSYNKCKKIMKQFKPDIVIGVGGYVTTPVLLAAHSLKIKILIHEQNSIPGKANLMLSKYADTICISMKSSEKYFDHKNVVFTGNPRGEEILKGNKLDKTKLGLTKNKKLVVITTGSLGSTAINNKIVKLLPRIKDKNYEVLFITGKNNYEELKQEQMPKNVILKPYIDNMNELLKVTDLIISRAGATTISEITSLAIPSILIPSPYVANNHQEINAEDLEKNNAACVIKEKDFDEDKFINMIDELLNDSKKIEKIKSNCKKMRVTDSATRIYKQIEKLVK